MNIPIALPETREIAIDALMASARSNPYGRTKNIGGSGFSTREWHEYSYHLILSIKNLR